eukprot:2539948-Rhodomonas_salina.1
MPHPSRTPITLRMLVDAGTDLGCMSRGLTVGGGVGVGERGRAAGGRGGARRRADVRAQVSGVVVRSVSAVREGASVTSGGSRAWRMGAAARESERRLLV